MKHLWKKIISMVLIAALLIQVLPATAQGAVYLSQDFEPQTGLSDMYEYLTYDVGKAGTLYVNTYTGEPHIRRIDYAFIGERMPVELEFYYDPVNEDVSANPYGLGWSTSYNQWIIYDSENEIYKYKNGKGTYIYFKNSGTFTEDNLEIWKEDTAHGIGQVGIELHRNPSEKNLNYASIIILYENKKYTFDTYGRLIKINDGTDVIEIAYVNVYSDAIKYIKDSVGRRYNFTYKGSYLYTIEMDYYGNVFASNTKMTYIIQNGILLKVGYPSGDYIQYEYDNYARLNYAINIDSCGYGFKYWSTNAKAKNMLSEIVQFSGAENIWGDYGEKTEFEHVSQSVTRVRSENEQLIYEFDKYGRICSYEQKAKTDDGTYQVVFGYTNKYNNIINEDGIVTNELVDVEYYDVNGIIGETDSEETITEEFENTEGYEETEETVDLEGDIAEEYVTTEDAYGNILTETNIVGDLQQSTSYNYILYGDLLSSVTDDNGSTQKYSYGFPINKPTAITDANGNKTSYTYNALWELASAQMDVSGLKTLAEDLSLMDDGTTIGVEYTYEKGRLTEIKYGDCIYLFTYDKWGNLLTVSMDGRLLVTYSYGEKSYKGLVHSITYGNGESVYYTYNAREQVVGIGYTENAPCFKYSYGVDGKLESIWDVAFQRVTQFTDNGYKIYSGTLNKCNKLLYEYEGTEENYSEYILEKILEYQVENNENISWLQVLDDAGVEIFSEKVTNDGFERSQEKILTVGTIGITQKYGYITNGNVTGNRVSDYTIEYKAGSEEKNLQFFYTYDGNGNILSIEEKEQNIGTSNWNYVYDEAGQLVDAYNSKTGIRYTYTYDKYGNLVCKEEYSIAEDGTETLIEQELMSYNGMILTKSCSSKTGETLYTTDAMGSITAISNSAETQQFTWGEGRMLLEMFGDDYQANYVYNDEGLRIIKELTQGNTTTYTEYEWGKNGLAGFTTGEDTVVILYGQDGTPIGFSLNDTVYTYIKNLQGDVIRILDTDGNTVVEYTYDPWGVPTVTGDTALAAINPCSYRCYDYDEESGYYYLQSRYYNPQTGRFLNADDTKYLSVCDSISSYNLFSYCKNNPITYEDKTGTIAITTCVIIGMIAGGIIGGIASKLIYGKVNGWWVLGGAVAGGVLGYVGGAFFGASGIKAGTLAAKIKMSKVRWLGKIGEKLSSIPKGKTQIESITGTAKYRVPDFWNKEYKLIGEVKNVKQLSYTKQIEDYLLYAQKEGYTFFLQVRKTTQLSTTLKKLVDAGEIVLIYIK